MNTRRSKRSREPDANSEKAPQSSKRIACAGPSTSDFEGSINDVEDKVTLSIMIKWSSMGDVDGRTKVKVNRLSLKELEDIDKLGE